MKCSNQQSPSIPKTAPSWEHNSSESSVTFSCSLMSSAQIPSLDCALSIFRARNACWTSFLKFHFISKEHWKNDSKIGILIYVAISTIKISCISFKTRYISYALPFYRCMQENSLFFEKYISHMLPVPFHSDQSKYQVIRIPLIFYL